MMRNDFHDLFLFCPELASICAFVFAFYTEQKNHLVENKSEKITLFAILIAFCVELSSKMLPDCRFPKKNPLRILRMIKKYKGKYVFFTSSARCFIDLAYDPTNISFN